MNFLANQIARALNATIIVLSAFSVSSIAGHEPKPTAPEPLYSASNKQIVAQEGDRTNIVKTDFGKTPDGQTVQLFTLTNANGLVAKISNYGAIVTEMHARDRNGKLDDVILGFNSLDAYLSDTLSFGAIVGRVANRIANAKFTLDGKQYQLTANDGTNHLHGGKRGFNKVVWKAETMYGEEGPMVKLTYRSPDGEEGYPGNLTVTASYTLTKYDELKLEITATTDKPTPVNLALHPYWNLAGHASGDVLGHKITINAAKYTPTNNQSIPTGEIVPVKGTPYDFSRSKLIGDAIAILAKNPDKVNSPIYDINYVLDGALGKTKLAATAYEPKSGRGMEIYTTQPGMQFYTPYFQDFRTPGKGNAVYKGYQSFGLQTQQFPDAVNQPNFPSVILLPGKTYQQVTIYHFYTRKN